MIIQGEACVAIHKKNGGVDEAKLQVSGENIYEVVGSVGAQIETAIRNPFHTREPKDIFSIEIRIENLKIS